MTQNIERFTEDINGVEVTVIDTPGFSDPDKTDRDIIQEVSKESDDIDLVLFCVRMDRRMQNADYRIMRKLTRAFGKSIWERTLFVLTFANKVHAATFARIRAEWDVLLRKYACTKGEIPADIVQNIPVVVAGDEEDSLPGCKSWSSVFWVTGFIRTKDSAKPAYLSLTLELNQLDLEDSDSDDDSAVENVRPACEANRKNGVKIANTGSTSRRPTPASANRATHHRHKSKPPDTGAKRHRSHTTPILDDGATPRQPTPGTTHRQATPGTTHRQATPGTTHRQATPGATHRQPTPGATHRQPTPGATHRQPTPGATHRQPTPGATRRRPHTAPISGNGATPRRPIGSTPHRSTPHRPISSSSTPYRPTPVSDAGATPCRPRPTPISDTSVTPWPKAISDTDTTHHQPKSNPPDTGATPHQSWPTPVPDTGATPRQSRTTPVPDTGSTPRRSQTTPVPDTGSTPRRSRITPVPDTGSTPRRSRTTPVIDTGATPRRSRTTPVPNTGATPRRPRTTPVPNTVAIPRRPQPTLIPDTGATHHQPKTEGKWKQYLKKLLHGLKYFSFSIASKIVAKIQRYCLHLHT